ncbi:hypothetical protein HanPSC8_Chr16g0729791 [Helianthus annuus]|nr:hypothetical protein HanPSC8_Chr16g0729791 [Helianthus annuus]
MCLQVIGGNRDEWKEYEVQVIGETGMGGRNIKFKFLKLFIFFLFQQPNNIRFRFSR